MMPRDNSKKVYQHVVEQIQGLILSGNLHGGERLPAERDMAQNFGVSRNSVREALRALEILGVVESRQGGGNYIRRDSPGLFEPLSMIFKLNEGTFKELLEFRRMLEMEASAQAAQRITPDQAEELLTLSGRMATESDELRRVELDKQIHFKIAEYSGNFLFVALYNAISRIFESFIKDARGIILRLEENRKVLAEQHRRICQAIADHDSVRASAAVAQHFEFIIQNLNNSGD